MNLTVIGFALPLALLAVSLAMHLPDLSARVPIRPLNDELILLTWLHLADRAVLQTHPTGDTNIPLTGVLRTRSPDRPNPIGVHRVAVTALEDPTHLRVGALEAIDGTPILDLKIAMRESPEA